MRHASWLPSPIRLAWMIAIAIVAWRLFAFLDNGLFAVRYPFEIDYGEGIVWQQADMIGAGQGYGDITRYPFIVFHYPPVYHLAGSLTDALLPGDWLGAARLVSLLSTLVAAAICAWMVALGTGRGDNRPAGIVLAVLFFLSAAPVVLWGALARVDMLALVLCLGGLAAGIHSFARPRLIIASALLFVLALFTRQTAIFAPAALFGVMLILRPRLAVIGIAWSIAFGIAGLGLMTALTDGLFVNHAFLYNVNRFSLHHFLKISSSAFIDQPQYWLVVFLSAIYLIALVFRSIRSEGVRLALGGSAQRIASSVAMAYFLMSLLSFVLVAKIGSNVNYFVDLCAAGAVVLGIAVARFAVSKPPHLPAGNYVGVALVIIIGLNAVVAIPPVYRVQAGTRPSIAEQNRTVDEIRNASKPVISDDMVLLRKAGKQVPWESAIFSELAYADMWDERQIVRMIDDRRFAFIRTVGQRGIPLFDARYRPAVSQAIDRAYPVTVKNGDFVNHYPTRGK